MSHRLERIIADLKDEIYEVAEEKKLFAKFKEEFAVVIVERDKARAEIERLKGMLDAHIELHAEADNELLCEREITAMLREALKECRLSAENHTGLNSKSVIMRVYDTSREALAREQEMRKT